MNENKELIAELLLLRDYVQTNGYDKHTFVNIRGGVFYPNEYMCHTCEVNGWEKAKKYVQECIRNHPNNYGCYTSLCCVGDFWELPPEEYQAARLNWLDEITRKLTEETK